MTERSFGFDGANGGCKSLSEEEASVLPRTPRDLHDDLARNVEGVEYAWLANPGKKSCY